jgi:hypothetical protein
MVVSKKLSPNGNRLMIERLGAFVVVLRVVQRGEIVEGERDFHVIASVRAPLQGKGLLVAPASNPLAMPGWSITARACFSYLKARHDFSRIHAELDDLERDSPGDRRVLLGHVDDSHAPFAEHLEDSIGTDSVAFMVPTGTRPR